MTESTDLAAIMALIAKGFPFTQERYPNGDLSTPEKIEAFAIRHSQAHMTKTTGQIAAEAEKYDHGGKIDPIKVRIAATKAVVNALNLANALGMTAEDLRSKIPEVMRST